MAFKVRYIEAFDAMRPLAVALLAGRQSRPLNHDIGRRRRSSFLIGI
jgi:hypothetical protein